MTDPAVLVEILDVGSILGESPLFDARTGRLHWIDIHGEAIGTLDVNAGTWSLAKTDGRPGCLALTADPEELLVAMGRRLVTGSVAGETFQASRTVLSLEGEPSGNRFNDGKTDRQGRLWIGTMDDAEVARSGNQYRIVGSDSQRRWDGVGVPNGTCFSPDGARMYIADSWDRTIWTAEYASDLGEPGAWSVLVETQIGGPDGSTVDEDGLMWNAEWGAARVVRYRPDGAIDAVVHTPVSRPTCPAFGAGLLFVTSAQVGGRERPDDGSLLIYDVGVNGVPETPWRAASEQ